MRSADGDYAAIEAALEPHQLRTIHDLAATVGLPPAEWWKHTSSRVVAKDLAVSNVMRRGIDDGLTQRRALDKAAALFNVDTETLQRRYRAVRRRNTSV